MAASVLLPQLERRVLYPAHGLGTLSAGKKEHPPAKCFLQTQQEKEMQLCWFELGSDRCCRYRTWGSVFLGREGSVTHLVGGHRSVCSGQAQCEPHPHCVSWEREPGC